MKRNIFISLVSILVVAGVAWAYTFTHTGPEIDQGVEVGLNVGAATGVIQSDGADGITSLGLTTTVGDPGLDTNVVSEQGIREAIEAIDLPTGNLPPAGATGESLVKASNADYDTEWSKVETLPAGGTIDQVLAKNSATDYDVKWSDNAGGGGCTTLACLTDVSGQGTDGNLMVDQGDGTFVFVNQLTGIAIGGFTPNMVMGSSATGVLEATLTPRAWMGRKDVCWNVFDEGETVVTGDGTIAYTVPPSLNLGDLYTLTCSLGTQGVTGDTTLQLRRVRNGASVDLLTTPLSLGTAFFATVTDANVTTLATGDRLFIDVDAVHTGTVPTGLSCVAEVIPGS